jgi:hypothetical protein
MICYVYSYPTFSVLLGSLCLFLGTQLFVLAGGLSKDSVRYPHFVLPFGYANFTNATIIWKAKLQLSLICLRGGSSWLVTSTGRNSVQWTWKINWVHKTVKKLGYKKRITKGSTQNEEKKSTASAKVQ